MTLLEKTEHWAQILELKDQLSLRDLAARFDTTPGTLSAALRRTGTPRSAFSSAPQVAVAKPAEPQPAPAPTRRASSHPGGIPDWWSQVEADLQTEPISVLAQRVGLTPGQFASELKRMGHRRVALAEEASSTPKRSRAGRRSKGSSTATAAGQLAWQVTLQRGNTSTTVVVLGASLGDAASRAESLQGQVTALSLIGELIP